MRDCTMIMFPVKDKYKETSLHFADGTLYCTRLSQHTLHYQYQELYVYLGSDFGEGDSIINIKTGVVETKLEKNEIKLFYEPDWRRIIASTDTSLELPIIPFHFIEEFVLDHTPGKNSIKVCVEMDMFYKNKRGLQPFPDETCKGTVWKAKANNENKINISKKFWSEEDLVDLFEEYLQDINNFSEWLKNKNK